MGHDNPHLMKFYEIHETTHSVYMVVEYFPGKELLRRIFKKKNINEKTIKVPMKSLLKAILYMHERGIMHRDIKPENIVLKEKKKLKSLALIDFGLATFIEQDKYIFYRCGTPGFIAPEIIRMKKEELTSYTEKCDIFSIGVIFYIL